MSIWAKSVHEVISHICVITVLQGSQFSLVEAYSAYYRILDVYLPDDSCVGALRFDRASGNLLEILDRKVTSTRRTAGKAQEKRWVEAVPARSKPTSKKTPEDAKKAIHAEIGSSLGFPDLNSDFPSAEHEIIQEDAFLDHQDVMLKHDHGPST